MRKQTPPPIDKNHAAGSHCAPWRVLAAIGACLAVAQVLQAGVGGMSYEYFAYTLPFRFPGAFHVDPILSTFVPKAVPLLFSLFARVYDIPVYHLIAGVLARAAFVFFFTCLSWRLTKSPTAVFLSLMMFIAFIFGPIRPRLPLGAMSYEIRDPMYLSFRAVAFALNIGAMLLLVMEQPLASGLLLGLALQMHPLNTMAFFLCPALGLALATVAKRDRAPAIKRLLWFIGGFALLAAPRIISAMGLFPEVTHPISSAHWWRFIMQNEPDDVSVIANFQEARLRTLIEFSLAVFGSLYFALPSFNWRELGRRLREDSSPLPFVIIAPLLVSLAAFVWESKLVYIFPDRLNDLLVPLELRRYMTVSAVFYVPAVAAGLTRLIFSTTGLARRDRTLAVAGSMLVLVLVAGQSRAQIRDEMRYLDLAHEPPDFFLERHKLVYPIGNAPAGEPSIPRRALIDVCDYVRKTLPIDAAIINPSYIKETRNLCERQAFLSEKFDGNLALTNRKLATIYLQRFADIHKGLTYDDFPVINEEGGIDYAMMRHRFLSLNEADWIAIRDKYPGYRYLLTEASARLRFPIVYRNDFFTLYDLGASGSLAKEIKP